MPYSRPKSINYISKHGHEEEGILGDSVFEIRFKPFVRTPVELNYIIQLPLFIDDKDPDDVNYVYDVYYAEETGVS